MRAIYLAASFERQDEMKQYRAELEQHGFDVTSRWLDVHPLLEGDFNTVLNQTPERYMQYAQEDLEDLSTSDTVISFTRGAGRGGRHVEFGVALADERTQIIIGPRENIFHTLTDAVYPDWASFRVAMLEDSEW